MNTLYSKLKFSSAALSLTLFALLAFAGGFVSAQTKSEKDCDKSKAVTPKLPEIPAKAFIKRFTKESKKDQNLKKAVWAVSGYAVVPQERAIRVRPNVFVSVCVRRGAVKVNGWDRQEVRAFNKGGKELSFKVIERGGKDKLPVWVEILGYEPDTAKGESDKCLTGEMIELDVPEGSSVKIRGESSETSIERVKNAYVNIVGGDIYLDSISDEVDASTKQGGVTVNNSSGKIALSTTTGNIVAYNTEPVGIGDYFKAKTQSGSLTLQAIGQKDVAGSTVTGAINYLGEIKNYGKYEFGTTYGMINIVIPDCSSFWVTASYGGRFVSEFPIKVITEDKSDSAFRLTGRVGAGEANLSLNSFSGTIRLRKKDKCESPKPAPLP